MAGRRTTPLFDLVSRGGPSRPVEGVPRPAKPIVRVELKPRESSAGVEAGPSARTGGAVPINYWYLGTAILLLIGIGAWAGGVLYGRGQERDRIAAELGSTFRDRPAVTEPGDRTPDGPLTTPAAPAPQPPASSPPTTPVQVPIATGPVLTARGLVADPRQKGLNYLRLADLPRADAEGAIAFLNANGLDVMGIPVDTPRWASKNDGSVQWYALYVNQGLTREQLGLPGKTALESQVRKLGEIWQRQHRGSSNFAQPGWEKLQ